MIRFDRVTFTYPGADQPTLDDVTLAIPEGELCLVVGRTGSGKSTLLRAVNGLVPHFSGGHLAGHVTVAGRDTRDHPPRALADVVGIVGQDPAATFVSDLVEDELAYGMENLGLAPDVMRRRVEEALDLLGLADLRHRALSTLSAGQQQRVAIGAVLTPHPRVLVLDEPTSALDPPAAEEVLAALQRLVHDLGLTVLVAEHRLERVVQYADRVVHVRGDGGIDVGLPDEVMAAAPVAPPVVELGRLARWSPLPMSVRDARRLAGELRGRLASVPRPANAPEGAELVVATRKLGAQYGDVTALRDVDLAIHRGEIVALMGRNGAGKSTLLAHLVGLRTPMHGTVALLGHSPAETPPRQRAREVGLVPHNPATLLYGETVAQECALADHEGGLSAGTTAATLARIAPGLDPEAHPHDLSEGERLSLTLAVVLGATPPLVLLDEPTRGLDYGAKSRLVAVLRGLAADGHAVLLASHDVELVAELATRVVVLADGEVVADGPTSTVLLHSPAFAPQVAKILAPEPWLTVGEVERALAVAG